MATIKFKSNYDGSDLDKNLATFAGRLAAASVLRMTTYGMQIKADAQKNRPWTDRTGMAKATLNTTVSQPSSSKIRLTLAHGVWYGKYLEYAHGKKYAIVMPTLNKWSDKVMKGMQGLFDAVGRKM